jgi:cyclopropane fatty-acyl-phospholipid synthase-like methyltransferase
MLRHHLFDVELIISITLVYGILTATLAGLFEITLVSVQHVLLVFTHVEDSRLAYFATAMVMATLFEPLKRRIDALVDSVFSRRYEG